MISCADSRVAPETITKSGPGELFVCHNVGNIVPSFSNMKGGVSPAIDYAVVALEVRDIIVRGHSDRGVMKELCRRICLSQYRVSRPDCVTPSPPVWW